MTTPVEQHDEAPHGHAYDLFILVLTVISLMIMVAMLLPLDDSTIGVLQFYDNLICGIFLIDFGIRLRRSNPRSDYFIHDRGWLDLLGSIPALGVTFRYTGILRLARLSRLARISRLLRGRERAEITRDVLANRGKYALFITILTTIVVLCTSSVLVLEFESGAADANIENGWDAFWYSVVTITTVGYGDFYPVTVGGRISAMFIMIAGVGVIGALASILASLLVGDASDDEPDDPASGSEQATVPPEVAADLAAIKAELAHLRSLLEDRPPPIT